jgi:hypothetical protein
VWMSRGVDEPSLGELGLSRLGSFIFWLRLELESSLTSLLELGSTGLTILFFFPPLS